MCQQPLIRLCGTSGESSLQAIDEESYVTTTDTDVLRLVVVDATSERSLATASVDLSQFDASKPSTLELKLYSDEEIVGKIEVKVVMSGIDSADELLPAPEMLAGFTFQRPWIEAVDLHRLRDVKVQQYVKLCSKRQLSQLLETR